MKLKNLSRLTALLMALSIFCGVAFAEGTAVYDVTGNFMEEIYKYMVTINMYFNGKCLKCAYALAKNGVTTWPADGDDCLYEQLEKLSSDSERYTLLTNASESLRTAYVEAHAYHNGKLLCTCDEMHAPGNDHAAGCPWYEANVVNGSNSTLEITVPDGAFDGAYTLSAANITDAETLAKVKAAVNEVVESFSPFSVMSLDAYDISFVQNGVTVQPKTAVSLNFGLTNMGKNGYEYQFYHVTENNGVYTAELVDYVDISADAYTVSASSFSVYVVNKVGDTSGTSIKIDTAGNTGSTEVKVGSTVTLYWHDDELEKVTASWSDIKGYYLWKKCTWSVDDPNGTITSNVYQSAGEQITNPDKVDKYHYPYIELTGLKAGTAKLKLNYYYMCATEWWGEHIYSGKNGEYVKSGSVTITVNVTAPTEGLYIADTIMEDGCIAPAWPEDDVDRSEYTYEWSRSDGQAISEVAKEGNKVNVANDRGGINEGGTPKTYTVTAKNKSGQEQGKASYTVMYGNEILNRGFESPKVSESISIPNGTKGFYWRTTGPGTDNKLTTDIELVYVGGKSDSIVWNGVDEAAEGTQFVEVNAEAFGTLYQDILTAPGAILSWSFSHRGRNAANAENTIYVIIASTETAQHVQSAEHVKKLLDAVGNGATDGTKNYTAEIDDEEVKFRIWKHEGDNNKWETFSGSYEVPNGQYLTRLFFASDPNGGNNINSTLGNLIDGVSARQTLNIKVEYYVDGQKQNTEDKGRETAFDYYTPPSYVSFAESYAYLGTYVNSYKDADNALPYAGDVANDGLYVTAYDGTADAGYDVVYRIYFAKQAVTLTKTVEFLDTEGNTLINDEINKLLKDTPYSATFTLKKDNSVVATAEISVSKVESGGTIMPTVEFLGKDGWLIAGTYTIEETYATSYPGYVLTTKYDDENKQFTLTSGSLQHEAKVTNTYKLTTTSLTIKKEVSGTSVASESFIFTVSADGETPIKVVINGTGSVTINGLKVGTEYTVTEDTSWSNRYGQTEYSVQDGKITLVADAEKNVVTVTNSGRNDQWLHNETSVTNEFTK